LQKETGTVVAVLQTTNAKWLKEQKYEFNHYFLKELFERKYYKNK
jgi:hypothetical protein